MENTSDETLVCSFSIFLISRALWLLGPSVVPHLIHFWYSNLTPAFLHSDAIELLPLVNSPEVFGLHPNADISYCSQAATDMWSDLLKLQPHTGEQIFAVVFQSVGAVLLRLLHTKQLIPVNLCLCMKYFKTSESFVRY